MTSATTLTNAGLLASAGAARFRVAAPAECPTATLAPMYGMGSVHQGSHLFSTWTRGAIAKPATTVVFDRKNRPSRPLSELSP